MKRINLNMLILAVFIVFGCAYSQNSTKYKVIVNKDNSVEEISKDELSDIFLKKVSKWQDKTKMLPVDLSSDSKTRQFFSKSVHNKSVNAIKAYWQKKIFTGKGVPPVEKSDDSEVVAFVKENTGAVGYVSSSASVSGVKVISVTD